MNQLKLITVAIALLASSAASAISTFEGNITELLVGPNYGSLLYIQVDKTNGTLTNEVQNCANPNWDYLIDTSTTSGNLYSSMILAAHMAGKSVYIEGYDDCSGNVERVRTFVIQ